MSFFPNLCLIALVIVRHSSDVAKCLYGFQLLSGCFWNTVDATCGVRKPWSSICAQTHLGFPKSFSTI